ncbi:MAG: hypothetical protein PHC88_07285 [Terrimicrobiaceae bacterium]|nr:hypothetical protein [Terrimicrobiaceae bacterium]
MIHANCRARFTADDFDFIVRSLSQSPKDAVSLQRLLVDADARDEILEHDALASVILESADSLRISTSLYFYVLCRRVLKNTAVSSREAADYIAAMLDAFTTTARVRRPDPRRDVEMRYMSDILLAIRNAPPSEAFMLRAHMANYALFLSGLFSENIDKRAQRGAPDLSFYEELGRSSYRTAAGHRDAKRFDLEHIYRELADGFREARLALNGLAERLFHLEAPVNLPQIG